MAVLFGGTATSQLIGILATPVIARLFAPEAFGALALFLSYTTIVGTVSCLRYDQAIMLPAQDRDAHSLLVLSLLVVTGVACLCGVVVHLVGGILLASTGGQALGPWFEVVPLFIWLVGIGQAFRQWFARRQRFSALARYQVARGISSPLVTIVAGISGMAGPAGLIIGRFVGLGLQTGALAIQTVRRDLHDAFADFRIGDIRSAARKHWRFPLLDTSSVLVFNIGKEIPVLFLALYLGEAVTGFYGLTILVLQAPATMVLAAVGQVLFQYASAKHAAGGEIAALLEDTIRYTLTAGMFPVAILATCGPAIFSLAFGPRWNEAGIYAALLAPWLLFFMVSNATAVLFRTLERQDLDLAANVLLLLVRLASLVVGARMFGDPLLAILLMSLSSAAVNAWRVYLLIKVTGAHGGDLSRHGLAQLACALPAIVMVSVASVALALPSFLVVVVAIAGAVPYIVLSLRRDPALKSRFQELVRHRI